MNYERVKRITGEYSYIIRFPGGSSTAKNLKEPIINSLREKGYGWVDWTASNGDGGDPGNKSKALSRFKKEIDEDIEPTRKYIISGFCIVRK